MNYQLDPTAELAASKRAFGQMLRRWRTRNSWSGKVPAMWAKAAPDVLPLQVSSATWTGFENGKAQAPAPETFIALEAMNLALATGQIGTIRDRLLKDRVGSAQPILHEDGTPWKAGDFFDCFIGALPPPAHLQAPEYDPAADSILFREQFTDLARERQTGMIAALLAVLRESQLPTNTTTQLEQVVLSQGIFQSKEAAAAAWEALRAWSGS